MLKKLAQEVVYGHGGEVSLGRAVDGAVDATSEIRISRSFFFAEWRETLQFSAHLQHRVVHIGDTLIAIETGADLSIKKGGADSHQYCKTFCRLFSSSTHNNMYVGTCEVVNNSVAMCKHLCM
jgi:hypothetical protein